MSTYLTLSLYKVIFHFLNWKYINADTVKEAVKLQRCRHANLKENKHTETGMLLLERYDTRRQETTKPKAIPFCQREGSVLLKRLYSSKKVRLKYFKLQMRKIWTGNFSAFNKPSAPKAISQQKIHAHDAPNYMGSCLNREPSRKTKDITSHSQVTPNNKSHLTSTSSRINHQLKEK